MNRLEGKIALITGAGSGIGRATSELFAREGAKLVIADYVDEGVQELAEELGGSRVVFIKGDVSKAQDVQKMVTMAVDTYGRLDILFNNAGVMQYLNTTVETSENDWDRVININLKGVFLGMKYAIPEMLKVGGGSIVNTASMCGLIALTYMPAYNTSKAGVIMLTKTAALEYAKQNIRINCVCPAVVDTAMKTQVRNDPNWSFAEKTRIPTPIGRPASPEEIASSVLFLACEDSSYVTGTALSVDGGYTAQ
jgi:NAD(P)-dependent dehydrogenase (short-subunit alcohol dehydrogenase family)